MDKEQFTAQVPAAEKSLYRVSRSILGNDEDCADAIQNAILHAYTGLHALILIIGLSAAIDPELITAVLLGNEKVKTALK